MSALAVEPTVADALIRDARPLLSPDDRPLVEVVIASLDDSGYLRSPPDELASRLAVDRHRLERVISALRKVGCPGLAAPDLRLSLLLQLDALETSLTLPEVVRRIVADHLDDLAAGRLARIALALGVRRAAVLDARRFIRAHLAPRPATGLRCRSGAPRLIPDIVIMPRVADGQQFDVESIAAWGTLTIDPTYRDIPRGRVPDCTIDQIRAARALVEQAREVVERIRLRAYTLERVAREVVMHQADYLRRGPAAWSPISRAHVARTLGLHESTVSRAVAHKLIELPDGRIVPFATLFDRRQVLDHALRALLESDGRRLSDAALADRLRENGYQVARRTVTKYRLRMGIAPAAARSLAEGESIFA
jgi:RNA polymerase sigma-54 factor